MLARINNSEISIVGGVLAGISYKLGLPTWIARLVFIVLLFASFFTVAVIYVLLWAVLPTEFVSKEDFVSKTKR